MATKLGNIIRLGNLLENIDEFKQRIYSNYGTKSKTFIKYLTKLVDEPYDKNNQINFLDNIDKSILEYMDYDDDAINNFEKIFNSPNDLRFMKKKISEEWATHKPIVKKPEIKLSFTKFDSGARYNWGSAYQSDIIIDGKMIGSILELKTNFIMNYGENDGKYTIRLMIKNESKKSFDWISLKAKFETPTEAEEFFKQKINIILEKYDIYYNETNKK